MVEIMSRTADRLRDLLGRDLVQESEKPTTVKRTYSQAQADILDYLGKNKWVVKTGLKVPHATSPAGDLRLWFKPQAVWFTQISGKGDRHDFKNARTVSYDQDIRKQDGSSFVTWVGKMFPKRAPDPGVQQVGESTLVSDMKNLIENA